MHLNPCVRITRRPEHTDGVSDPEITGPRSRRFKHFVLTTLEPSLLTRPRLRESPGPGGRTGGYVSARTRHPTRCLHLCRVRTGTPALTTVSPPTRKGPGNPTSLLRGGVCHLTSDLHSGGTCVLLGRDITRLPRPVVRGVLIMITTRLRPSRNRLGPDSPRVSVDETTPSFHPVCVSPVRTTGYPVDHGHPPSDGPRGHLGEGRFTLKR